MKCTMSAESQSTALFGLKILGKTQELIVFKEKTMKKIVILELKESLVRVTWVQNLPIQYINGPLSATWAPVNLNGNHVTL